MANPPISFPEGIAFLRSSRSIEGSCEATSDAAPLSSPSTRAQVEQFGTVLSLLYRLACCYWGCHGKEHIIEYLAGRTVTSVQAGYRLLGFGYYDEALALARNVSETGNLAQLFFTAPDNIRSWLDSTDKDRRRKYSPAAVRNLLMQVGSVVPTDQEEYSWLCEVSTHVTPNTRPQAHQNADKPILGAVYQSSGWGTAFERLAWSLCTVAGPVAKVAVMPRESAERLVHETITLVELISEA